MDYFLIYKDKKGKKRAAVPDAEGVYKTHMPFEEYEEDLTSIEVVIAKVYDLDAILENCDCDDESDDEYVEFQIIGKFISSQPIHKCIDKMGFEKFFTSIIKKHIETAADIEEE